MLHTASAAHLKMGTYQAAVLQPFAPAMGAFGL